MKKALVIFAIAIVYLQIGLLFSYWIMYAVYHQRSTAAKIIFPLPSNFERSPFSSKTPEINPAFQRQYSTFNDYFDSGGGLLDRILLTLFWPFQIVIWLAALSMWVVWGMWLAIKFLIWLIFGGFLQWIGAFG